MTGDLFAIASAFCFAAANVTIVRGAAKGDDDNGAFLSLLLTAAIAGTGWLGLGIANGFVPITARALLWFAIAGILTGFIGRVFLFVSVQRLGAMRASAIKRLNPFFAVLLGVLVLGEHVSLAMALGMALIVASFGLLVKGAIGQAAEGGGDGGSLRRFANLGYFYGPLSALGYATGYLFRKMGLAEMPDAFFGTTLGAIVGAALFVGTGAFHSRYARAVRATFAKPNPWLLAAGVASSFGQILYFFALQASPMSRVALIVSMEVFVTLALGALFLRKHETLTPAVGAAAVLGVAGTAFIVGA